MAKGKLPSTGNPWERSKGSKPSYRKPSCEKPQQGLKPPKFDANVKRNDACSYCGKFGNHSRYFHRRKYHEYKHRNIRHTSHFVDGGETINDDFKNLRLFISYASLSTEIDDSNAWFVDSGASIHMSCNKD
jgi:hypothetical protein